MHDRASRLQNAAPKRGPSFIDVHIGRRIRTRRLMMGLSQEDLAAAIGVAFQQIQKYECAINRVSTARLWAMSRALQCPVAFFYAGMSEQPDDTADPDIPLQQETLKLLRAYATIKQPEIRQQILSLATALGGSAAGV